MSSEGTEPQTRRTARFLERMSPPRTQADETQEIVGAWTLRPVAKRAGLTDYIRSLVARRHFIWADARIRAFSRNRGMILGNLWLVLLPLFDGLFYYAIFGIILQVSRDMENFIAFLLIGIFMFQFTARSLSGGAAAITGAQNMIRAFTFPRASLPIAILLRETISMLPVIGTMIVLLLVVPPHVSVTPHWALFPLLFALQALFNLGIVFIAARATAHIPDIRHLTGIISRFWRYGSAVMFPFSRFVDDPRLLSLLELNPLYLLIDMYRLVLLHGEVPSLNSWVTLVMWAAGSTIFGFTYFWRAENRYGRE